jgi:bifunctional UDP-N-acetylglucosamine pyrophosphorylase / glucosamine-1-phosphate N-acetyltransferase
MTRARAAIILAAGHGTRMKSELPKVLHEVGGRAMLDWAIEAAQGAGAARIIVVVGANADQVRAHVEARLGAASVAVQDPPLGTAHAVRAAEASLAGFEGDVIVLYADAPLVRAERLEAMFAARAAYQGVAVLGFRAGNPKGYGRIIQDKDGRLLGIVEEKDASPEQRAVDLCNAGVLCADAKVLFQLLSMVRNDNAQKEFYLTDVVALGRSSGFSSHVVEAAEDEVLGVNSRVELAKAEALFQSRARRAAMEAGVTLIDPQSAFFSYDTEIAADVVIEPNVVFGKGVKIGKGVRIYAFCHFERTEIGEGAQIGPFARFRPGAKLGRKVKIGNFVEVKNSVIADGAKASHLSYIGDATVGARANLGAGTITCNYDGFDKYRTEIGEDAFIGSDTSLVAPVKVGARAFTGAGSVITKDVSDDALAVSRGRQTELEGWGKRFRARKQADRTKKDKAE